MVRAGSVELCAQAFGTRGDPAVLLISGSSSSMDWWEPGFCTALAGGGRFVIRYDLRDTGQSVHYPVGSPDYGSRDLVADVAGLLDAYGVERACLLGISMGGAIAQLTALLRPSRVSALVLLSTFAPGGPPVGMDPALAEYFQQAPETDWSDPAAVLDQQIDYQRELAAESVPFDEPAARALTEAAFARTLDVRASLTNHDLIRSDVDDWYSRLGEIRVPTLVVHGAEDRFIRPAHGEALARSIPGARLLLLPGVGHEFPRRAWGPVVPAVLEVSGA
ncbi:MAG TPA: alpha/beta fold hydrolase [Mycobacteriales bacterium]|jgi:pimeloyl-ACP methyl ester carboxylesterase|nr:alpha/beta fold hydrolase [Mycobacteriales bacterium]